MTSPSRSRAVALVAIAALLMLLMLPNLIWLGYSHALTTWVEALVLPLALLAILFALLGRWPWIACLLLAPFAMLAPLEIFYVSTYRAPSTPTVVATIVATTPREAYQFFGAALIPIAIAVAAGGALALSSAWLAHRTALRWRGSIPTWIAAVTIITPVVGVASAVALAPGSLMERFDTAATQLDSLAPTFRNGYPFGTIDRVLAYRDEWESMYADTRRFRSFSFHAQRVGKQPTQRQVYVLVIGESSARDHWQLFGYDRATNPELSKVPDLVLIRHMLSAWPETIGAVPVMLTRKPITDSSPDWGEPSFLPALQEAGYQTWWISNQYPIGVFDSPVAVYAFEAQHTLWLNHAADWHNVGNVDEDLVSPLRKVIASTHGNLFVVLHMLGSHRKYDYRYPPSFEHWKPTQISSSDVGTRYERSRNSYDNAIRYTDHVLAQIITVLRNTNAVSALWYESDHGEVLPTPSCPKKGHGLGTWHEFRIPAFFWYSDAYAQDFPRRVTNIRANADRRTISGDTFASIIDMTGVDFVNHDESHSLFSRQLRYRTRWVTGLWRADFDHATFTKGCGFVFPDSPASPLPHDGAPRSP